MAVSRSTGTAKAAASLDAAQRMQNTEVDKKENVRLGLAALYAAEKGYTVIGAPMYRAYFGNKMPISLNGIPVYVPLDGNRYILPDSYARVFNERIRSVNDEIEMQRARSNVKANYETFPGELDLVRQG